MTAWLRGGARVVLGGMALLLSGCGAFFVKPTTTTTTTTNTGDYVFVSNSTSGSNYISGYSITSGVLTAISGASINLGYLPVAMSVSPNNEFLYVAAAPGSANPGIYLYTVSSTGVLAQGNNGNPLVSDNTVSTMDISPDGNFLFTVGTTGTGVVLNEFSLSSSTGLFGMGQTTFPIGGTSCTAVGSPTTGVPVSQQCTVKVAPSGNFVGVAQGGYGATIYPYSSSGGVLNTAQYVPVLSTTSGDFSLAFDKNNYVYVASTLALTSYGGLGGTAAPTQGTTAVYGGGVTPRSVALSTSFGYVYTANEGTGTISGFALSGAGVLTAIGTAAVPGPTNVSAIAADSSGKYLVAAGYNATNGLQLFNITSTGALTTAGSVAGTGSSLTVPVVMALSH